jgi:hypothetical protein
MNEHARALEAESLLRRIMDAKSEHEAPWDDVDRILGRKPPNHFVSAACAGETCRMCLASTRVVPAFHKVGEETYHDQVAPVGHNMTAYVCCACFGEIMGIRCKVTT